MTCSALGWASRASSEGPRPEPRNSRPTSTSGGGEDLVRRTAALRPTWLAFLGVTGYRAAFGAVDTRVGAQSASIGDARVWILPNPSGLNAHYPPAALAVEFAKLRVAAGLPDRSGLIGDGPFGQSAR